MDFCRSQNCTCQEVVKNQDWFLTLKQGCPERILSDQDGEIQQKPWEFKIIQTIDTIQKEHRDLGLQGVDQWDTKIYVIAGVSGCSVVPIAILAVEQAQQEPNDSHRYST